jgi:Na+-translocating ferredoxin:NAD+ oxidoreductase RnfC subunit
MRKTERKRENTHYAYKISTIIVMAVQCEEVLTLDNFASPGWFSDF